MRRLEGISRQITGTKQRERRHIEIMQCYWYDETSILQSGQDVVVRGPSLLDILVVFPVMLM
jgi:hypothetical protein